MKSTKKDVWQSDRQVGEGGEGGNVGKCMIGNSDTRAGEEFRAERTK